MTDKIKSTGINSQGYGIIPKSVMRDTNLSIQAKSVYAYMRSYTGAGDTCYPTKSTVCSDLKISDKSLSKYLKELTDIGYISIEQNKKNGKFSNNIYRIHEDLTVGKNLPYGKKTVSVSTVVGNFPTNNNTSLKLTDINNITPIVPLEEFDDEVELLDTTEINFNTFWKMYPKKKSKETAFRSFKKIKPDNELFETIIKKLELFKQTKDWKKDNGQFIPYASTWLNQKRWEDEIQEKDLKKLTTKDIADKIDFTNF